MHAIVTLINVCEGEKSFTTIASEVLDLHIPAHP
jgi:hypothetical protein